MDQNSGIRFKWQKFLFPTDEKPPKRLKYGKTEVQENRIPSTRPERLIFESATTKYVLKLLSTSSPHPKWSTQWIGLKLYFRFSELCILDLCLPREIFTRLDLTNLGLTGLVLSDLVLPILVLPVLPDSVLPDLVFLLLIFLVIWFSHPNPEKVVEI